MRLLVNRDQARHAEEVPRRAFGPHNPFFAAGKHIKEFQAFERQAVKGLTKLNAAARLVELRNPPSNRFEALGGERNGQYSIRINNRWRICFCWAFSENPAGKDPLMVPGDAVDVEIVDYH